MKGYKAFEKGLVCKGKQYAENTVFEEPDAILCKRGMHFCKNPMDVLSYYNLVNENGEIPEFAEVEALDEPKTNGGKKFCTKKLKVRVKLSLSKLIDACVSFLLEKTEDISSGDCLQLASSGNDSQLASSGLYSRLASAGNSSRLASSGDYSQLASSGDYVRINSEGEDSVICCAGHNARVKAKKGSWITLSEWEHREGKEIPKCVKTEYIDGERIKEDTFYSLKNGEFVEV